MRLLGFKHLVDATIALNDATEKNACEATSNGGGTFFYESTNNPWGQCCPNGKHVHERTSKLEMAMLLCSRSVNT